MPAILALAGCQRYQPQPLDAAAHQSAWRERSPAHDDVRAFAQRLAESGGSSSQYDPADGLTLAEAELVALVFNPELRVERARVSVAQANATFAGQWEDPVFSLDLLRIVESVPEPWILGTSLGFTIPISGRLATEKSRAAFEQQAALFRAAEREWEMLSDLRSLWLEWSSARMQSEVAVESVQRLQRIAEMTNRLEEVGEIPRIESRLFSIEAVTQASEARALDARAEDLELKIKSVLGLRPEAAVMLEPLLAVEPAEGSEELMTEANPTLAVARAEYEVAERTLEREIRKQYPDLVIGPAYENEDDQSRIGFSGSLPIPLLNRNQGGIAEAQAQREVARAEFEAKYEHLVHQLARAHREHELLMQARIELETTLIPLVEDQLRDAERMIELGELNSLIQLESVVRRADAKAKLIEARERESQAASRIRWLIGPAASPPLLPEPEAQQ